MEEREVPLCICGHPIEAHKMNYVPGRIFDRRGMCLTCGVHENGNLPCPAYQPAIGFKAVTKQEQHA